MDTCFFCKKKLTNEAMGQDASNDGRYYDCPRCGVVNISGTLSVALFEANRHLLSGLLRWRKIRGRKYRTITTYKIKELLSDPEIPQTIPQKVDKLIEYFAIKSETFGAPMHLNGDEDYPITFSPDKMEFDQIVAYLHKNKPVERTSVPSGNPGLALSMDGWKIYYDLQKKSADLKQCFVAMNFDDAYDSAFQKISEAAELCGFEAYRVKDVQHNDDVTDLIIAEIKKSRFLIADFTGQRAGVYFEAGYARGLGRTVIWTCQENDKDNIHFDTDHFAHIFWKDGKDLKKQLIDRIEATIK